MASSTVSNGMSLSRSMARNAAMSTFIPGPPLPCRPPGGPRPRSGSARTDRIEQGDLLLGRRGELDLHGGVGDVGVAHLAQRALDQQRDGVVAGRADPPGRTRRPSPGPDGDQAQVRPPPVPWRRQRPVHTRRGDLQRVRAADEVLVAVELVGRRTADPGDVVQPAPASESTTSRTVCRRPALRTSRVSSSNPAPVTTGSSTPRSSSAAGPSAAADLRGPGLRGSGRGGAGRGHRRRLLICRRPSSGGGRGRRSGNRANRAAGSARVSRRARRPAWQDEPP